MNSLDLTLIIPAKNEKESLPSVLAELKNYDCKIKVILEENDKETIDAIKLFNCALIFQKKNGYGNALIEGIESVDTEYFCIFNADGSFNPNELLNMLNLTISNNYGFIFASRYEKNCGSEDDTIITSVGNFIFTLLGKIFFKLPITDILYTFVIGRSDQAKKLKLNQHDFGFCVELPIKAQRQGIKLGTSKSYERKSKLRKKYLHTINEPMDWN